LLATSPDLIVRSTGSILRYQDQLLDPRRVGEELDASAVLDASFQRLGGRFRVTARLMETATGRSLWAGKVDVKIDDLFEVQDQVAQGIAEGLTPRLTRPASAAREFVPAPEAYLHYMRGMNALGVFTETSVRDSIREFERAVELERDYAAAWLALGRSYHSLVDGGFHADPSWYEKAEAALARAREVDPHVPHLYWALGALHLVRGRKREAYRDLAIALERAPNFAYVHHYFAYLFRLCDMPDESYAAELRAQELDPNVILHYTGLCRAETLRRGADEGIAWLNKARERLGPSARLEYHELRSLAFEGRYAEIKELMQRRQTSRPTGGHHHWESLFWLLAGEPERAAGMERAAHSYAMIDMDGAE
ncbi:MAG TPA: hypothetical protein VFV24_00890, partial [Candidatus Eisenbacteria bacterium]|nr:hypothetical protein [Candidatus Eisenbacteria bacterium]